MPSLTLPYNIPPGQVLHTPHVIGSNIGPARVIGSGAIRSENFVTGVRGWSIDGDGNVEFNDGVFRGEITATAIDITGDGEIAGDLAVSGSIWVDSGGMIASGENPPYVYLIGQDNGVQGRRVGLNFDLDLEANHGSIYAEVLTTNPHLVIRPPAQPSAPGVVPEIDIGYMNSGTGMQFYASSGDEGYVYFYLGDEGATHIPVLAMECTSNVSGLPQPEVKWRTSEFVVNDPSGANPMLDLFGAWTPYTPAFGNLTVGNGTVSAKYIRVGKLVIARGSLIFGSTTSISGSVSVTGPLLGGTRAAVAPEHPGLALYVDSGTRNYLGMARILGSGFNLTHTESGNSGFVNATNPFTWTTGDILMWTLIYEVAN